MWACHSDVILAIHGGAGTRFTDPLSAEREAGICAGLTAALTQGWQCWQQGADAVAMAVAAVVVLEDCEHFNAGRGSVFTHEGTIEMDAAVMRGLDRQAGAIAGVRAIRNPIELARAVLMHSPHVLLSGAGAEAFAAEHALATAPDSYFFTEYRWQQLERARADRPDPPSHGTVGAVARDHQHHLAAATSTGGMTNKRFGRIGDSPLIGAGTYADNRACAVSATGHGEYLLRAVIAHEVANRMRVGGMRLQSAAEAAMAELAQLGGGGGLIALDSAGNCVLPFNTPRMYRGWLRADGTREIALTP
jgi:beta-aspartyl-peptidase (threonine type)